MSAATPTDARDRWKAVESNPEVFTNFAANLGVPEGKCMFSDIWGLDDDMLAFLPQPVMAVLLCRPSGLNKVDRPDPESVYGDDGAPADPPFYMTQIDELGNACGTIAMVHALANTVSALDLADDSILRGFLDSVAEATPLVRGETFAANERIRSLHNGTASQGQSAQPESEASIAAHFICFAFHDGILYELDGRKPGPIPLARCSADGVAAAAAAAIKTYFMAPNPDEYNFSMVAYSLVPPA
ncbi:ubiquitin carboxyl-terminal esterase L3 [Thecamonas trahens ATCC 50062]|uniref:Ubiquitin carboxyl-terminal hydrolase n=1 Tax=Thecamonas trahens ATCC 50062 TaxID=461836 RepID=A0A0L0D141_THETB|nr:ubiquitin carboxyl-terminal esterase L3 [Thecamonas trahens ATCC 50062]KNC45967.1 ubiquitin carboxyl-terminal esterase L3 [Thecamonas trahens ATCC 50062]|eukprot:XP_013762948.1 ubiquitin carboxyl-terminal esterase L3 [Thecamonas trahens ATCC 50062]